MTRITVVRKEGRVAGFKSIGHAGSHGRGGDIVCAALSGITQTALLGLIDRLGDRVTYTRDDKKGLLEVALPEGGMTEAEAHDTEVILRVMLLGIKDLSGGYPDKIKMEDD